MELSYKYKLIFCMVISLMSLSGYANDSIRTEQQGDKIFVIHQIEKGETLYSLSKRYNVEIAEITSTNGIVDNQLSLGQVIKIPIKTVASTDPTPQPTRESVTHVVKTSETLYSLSRQYNVSVDQIKSLNSLASNEISIGQELVISAGVVKAVDPVIAKNPEKPVEVKKPDQKEVVIEDGYSMYYVQSGDLLESIAKKFGVTPDSIVIWNNLPNNYLKIGQKLKVKGMPDSKASRLANVKKTPYGTIRSQTDASGFTKIFEEGVAGKIESSMETDKYLALHRTLPIGKLIEIRNLMNNQKVFVRIVGNLPETGLNENVLLRLTPICFERLGVIDPKTRVEVSYYQD